MWGTYRHYPVLDQALSPDVIPADRKSRFSLTGQGEELVLCGVYSRS